MTKSFKEIVVGALKVVLYASASASTVALVGFLESLSKTEQGMALVIINALLYVLVQIVQPLFKK